MMIMYRVSLSCFFVFYLFFFFVSFFFQAEDGIRDLVRSRGLGDVYKRQDSKNVYVSFITELELLGFAGITLQEHQRIENFLKDCIIIDYNESIKQATIKLKQINRIKLPDAIIGATSIYMNIPLISADSVFETIDDIQFIKYEKQTG